MYDHAHSTIFNPDITYKNNAPASIHLSVIQAEMKSDTVESVMRHTSSFSTHRLLGACCLLDKIRLDA